MFCANRWAVASLQDMHAIEDVAINTDILKALVEDELARMADARVTSHIRSLLIEPKSVLRDWDYGEKVQQYDCWIVLEHNASETGSRSGWKAQSGGLARDQPEPAGCRCARTPAASACNQAMKMSQFPYSPWHAGSKMLGAA
jgi:hypothetical protein